jgi:uncharacterized protein YqfB (UPF0267 family)
MLLFKKKFLGAIRSGQKTQTIRLWKYRRMRSGQRSYSPGAGYIRITAVEAVALEDLTDEDARLDGFETADQLRAEIAQLYPSQLAAGHQAYRVEFQLLPNEERGTRNEELSVQRSSFPSPLAARPSPLLLPSIPFRAQVKIRYRSRPVDATVELLPGNRFRVCFDEPCHGIAPGQAAVCYQQERVLGGGWIEAPSA